MSKNQIALFEDQLALMANEAVKAEQSSLTTTFLSTQGGQLKYRGDVVAGNKLTCVILAAPVERLYYDTRFDPTKIVPPACFGISVSAIGMKPSDMSPKKQDMACESCSKNEWGSAANGGKGKACRETRRLLLIPADSINTASAVEAAEVAALRPPVTSLKNYANYVQTIAATMRRPPLAVVTELAVVPDAKTQFKVTFTMVKPIDNQEVLQALIARAAKETDRAIETAGAMNEVEPDEAPVAQSTRF